jgi:hypothetical protein
MLRVTFCSISAFEFALADTKHSHHSDSSIIEKGGTVPLFKGLFALEFPVTTKNKEAQAYFNQGLVLTYGFDHLDAEVSFLEAAKHDPNLAMAYWAVAFVLGPNINAAMEEANVTRAYNMVQKALSPADKASEKERALMRHWPNATHPNQYKIVRPWDYWTGDDRPRPCTPPIREDLEKALKDHPRHPHVHHLYIHLKENSPIPETAVKSADTILNLVPASGHLVHMAGHAYYVAGLYHDCSHAMKRL